MIAKNRLSELLLFVSVILFGAVAGIAGAVTDWPLNVIICILAAIPMIATAFVINREAKQTE